MNKILEAYKESGLAGVIEYIESLHDTDYAYEDYDENDTEEVQAVEERTEEATEDIDEAYLEKVIELEYLLNEKSRVYAEFPQTLLSALHGTELLKEPHIEEWYQYMKDTLNREPVMPLWKQPKKCENKMSYKSHTEFILGLVQLEDNCFVTSSEDGNIHIWEYEPIEEQRIGYLNKVESLEGHEGKPVNNLAYDSQRRLIASAGDDHKIKLWNRDTYECVAVLEGHTNYVSYLVMGDQLLYSASKDARIGVWDLDKMTNVTYMTEHQDWVVLLTLSPDNHRLISTSTNGDLFEWDAKTFTLKNKINEGGKTLFVPDTNLYIVNNQPELVGHDGHPEWFQWLSNNRLVTGAYELVLWDTDKWSIIQSFGRDYFDKECFLVIDGYIVTFEGTIKIYDINSEALLKVYPVGIEDKIQRAIFNKKEQLIITCSLKGYITIWDWQELLKGDYNQGLGVDIHSMEVFKDTVAGRDIALCGGFTWNLAVFDLETGELTQRIQRPAGAKGFVDIKRHSVTGQAILLFEQSICLCDPFHPEVQQLIPLPQKSGPREILTTRHGLLAASQNYPPYRINTKNQNVFAYDTYSYLKFIESPDGRYAIATTYPTDLSKDGVPFNEKLKPLTSPAIWLNLESGRKEGEIWYSNLSKNMRVNKKAEDFAEKNFKNLFPLYPTAAAWSPDGQQVAIGFNKGKLLIYDVFTRKMQKRKELEGGKYIAVNTKKKRNGLEDGKYISYMAWTEPHVLTVFASGTAFAVDINTLKVVKSLAISTEPTYHYTSFGGGRYLVWGNGKRKIIGIFDTQEFSIKWMVSLPAIPSEVLVNEGRLLIGGEDGLLYAYSINGVI